MMPTIVPLSADDTETRLLPSGRSLVLRIGEQHEEIELRGADGQIDVHLRLTDDGPDVRVRGGALSIEAADSIHMRCREFSLHTEKTHLHSDAATWITARETRIRTEEDVWLNGAFVRLNCDENQGPSA